MSSMTALAASGFTFVSWWQPRCVHGRADHFPAHHQELTDCSGSLWFYLRIVVTAVLCSWSGRLARPRTQHGCHHDMEVKPEAATAVIELLMMGGEAPETRWAVNKRQDNKLESCCIWLYLNHCLHFFSICSCCLFWIMVCNDHLICDVWINVSSQPY